MLRLGLKRSSKASTSSVRLSLNPSSQDKPTPGSVRTRVYKHQATGPSLPARTRWDDAPLDVDSLSPEIISLNYKKWDSNTPDLGYHDLVQFPVVFESEDLKTAEFTGRYLANRPIFDDAILAKKLISSWGLDKMENLHVVESYAGLGTLTEEILKLPNVASVLVMEENKWMSTIVNDYKKLSTKYPRLLWKRGDPAYFKNWSAPDVETHLSQIPIDHSSSVHPNLFAISHLQDSFQGDKFFYTSTITGFPVSWLWRFGRFRHGFTHTVSFFDRIHPSFPADKKIYPNNKFSVLTNALGTFECTLDPQQFYPIPAYFNLPQHTGDRALQTRRWMASRYTPRLVGKSKLWADEFEFLVTSMYIHKAKSVKRALDAVGHGASRLFDKLKDQGHNISESTLVREMPPSTWILLADEFHDWPFKPDVYASGGWALRKASEYGAVKD